MAKRKLSKLLRQWCWGKSLSCTLSTTKQHGNCL